MLLKNCNSLCHAFLCLGDKIPGIWQLPMAQVFHIVQQVRSLGYLHSKLTLHQKGWIPFCVLWAQCLCFFLCLEGSHCSFFSGPCLPSPQLADAELSLSHTPAARPCSGFTSLALDSHVCLSFCLLRPFLITLYPTANPLRPNLISVGMSSSP